MIDYNSNIWKYYFYKILTSLEIAVPIYVLFLLSNNLSMTQAMFLQSFYTFLIVVFEIPSGVFADMYGRRRTLIIASLFLGLAFMVFWMGRIYLIFFIAAFLWAVSRSLTSGADVALLYDTLKSVKKTKLFPKFNGRANAVEMLTLGASSLIGGYFGDVLGNRPLFLISSIIFFLSFFFAFSFKEPKQHKKILEKNYIKHLKGSIIFSFTHKTVRHYLIFFSFYGFFAFMLYFLIQPFLQENAETKLIVGTAVAGYFIFCSVGSFIAEHIIKRINSRISIVLIALISGLAFTLMPFVNIWFAVVLVFINSLITGVAGIIVNHKINENTGSHHRATTLSIMNFMQKIIYAIIAPLIGYMTDTYSIGASFTVLGIGLLIIFIYYLIIFLLRDHKKEPVT